jgi:hypothetical protein
VDWISSGVLDSGTYGTVGAVNGNWSFTSNGNCSIERRLYCFQQ